jgi:hypothetical protein
MEQRCLCSLPQEFATCQQSRRKLMVFRTEAVHAGFARAYEDTDFAAIREIAALLPERVIEEGPDLLTYVDAASLHGQDDLTNRSTIGDSLV